MLDERNLLDYTKPIVTPMEGYMQNDHSAKVMITPEQAYAEGVLFLLFMVALLCLYCLAPALDATVGVL